MTASASGSSNGKVSYAWKNNLSQNKTGTISCLSNVVTILANDPRWHGIIVYDDFKQRVLFASTPPFDADYAGAKRKAPYDVSDDDATRIVTWLDRVYKVRVGREIAAHAMETVARNHAVHPVRSYLDGLRWDGKPRLRSWLVTYLGVAPDDPTLPPEQRYVENVGSWWMISAAARILHPGCKSDYLLILEGPQRKGKSTALSILGGDWFTDELSDLRSKDAEQQLSGVWIVEIGELHAIHRADDAFLKGFFSRKVDRYRPPYGRLVRDFPRQCVFAGTTNEEEYLRDATGNSRYWPVRCAAVDPETGRNRPILLDALRDVRDQLWAEAVYRCREDEPWWPDLEQHVVAEAHQDLRMEHDAWIERVRTYVMELPESIDRVTIGEVLSGALRLDTSKWTRSEQMRAARILGRLGFSCERSKTKREYVFPEGFERRPKPPVNDGWGHGAD